VVIELLKKPIRYCSDNPILFRRLLTIIISSALLLSPLLNKNLNAEAIFTYDSIQTIQQKKTSSLKKPAKIFNFRYTFLNGSSKTLLISIKKAFPLSEFLHDERTNSIVCRTSIKKWVTVKDTLKLLDVQSTQIKIDVKIVESISEKFTSLQPGLASIFNEKQLLDNSNQLNLNAIFQGTIDMMIKTGEAKVLASPSIQTMNNQKSSISFGNDIPYTTSTLVNNALVSNLKYMNTGVQLDITPLLTSKNIITLTIDLKVTTAKGWREFGGQKFPLISNRSASSKVYLNNKEPLILAGLFDEETKINSQRIPLLGDIPFIGDLFKQTSKETSQSEILFIITPEIML